MKRRREDRIELALPVRIFGIDAQGRPFNVRTETVDVTRLGARIHNVTCFSEPGEIVGIQFEDKKARFRVMWIGAPGSEKEGDIGVQLLESEKPIWEGLRARNAPDQRQTPETGESRFSGSAPGVSGAPPAGRGQFIPNSPLAPSALSNFAAAPQVVKPSPELVKPFQDSTKAPFRPMPGPGKPQSPAATGDGRRQHMRLRTVGGIELKQVGTQQPYWGHIGDLSRGGCYVETIQPLPVDTFVQVLIRAEGAEFRSAGLVRTSHPHVGMGLCFSEMDHDNRIILEGIIERLERKMGLRKDQPAASGASLMPARAERAREVREREAPPVQDELHLSQRLHEVSSELRLLEQSLVIGRVDPRVQRHFQEASEYTRQAAWAVQHFIELQLQNRDPFAVYLQLDVQRIKLAADLSKSLCLDLDSQDLDTETEGMAELFQQIEAIYARLARLFRREAQQPPKFR